MSIFWKLLGATAAPRISNRNGSQAGRRLSVEALESRLAPSASATGNLQIGVIPGDVRDNHAPTGNTMVVSYESQQTLSQPLTVDIASPAAGGPEQWVGGDVVSVWGPGGTYPRSGTVLAGTQVNSYLLRFDPATAGTLAIGTITFTGETVVGIISESGTLDASDGPLGAPGVTYATGEPARGLEIGSQSTGGNLDAIMVPGTHQILFGLKAGAAQDQIRIITIDDPPQVPDQAFAVSESAEAGTVVGTLAATPGQPGDVLNYAIIGGNTHGTYAVDASTGRITIASAAALDYETHPQSILQIQVTDQRGHSGTGFVTINVANAAPSAPVDSDSAANCPFVTATNGEPVGLTVRATDPHGGAVTYSLTDSAAGRFAIDPQTGIVTVANRSLMQGNTDYSLTARADDGHGGVSTATFHVFSTALPDASPVALTAQADAYYAQGLYAEAAYLDGVVIEMTPQDPAIYEKRGDALSALGLLGDAVYAYTVSANLAPTNGVIFEKLGTAQVANGQLAAGIYSLTIAVNLVPTSGLYKLHLGEAQYAAGMHDDARYTFTWAMVNDPSLTSYIYAVYGDLF